MFVPNKEIGISYNISELQIKKFFIFTAHLGGVVEYIESIFAEG